MKLTRILLAAMVVGAFLVCAVLFTTGTARADEGTFIDALRHDGIPVASTTLGLGHLICNQILADGEDGVTEELNMAIRAGVSGHDAADIVWDSVYELCPSAAPALQAWITDHPAKNAAAGGGLTHV